MKLLSRALIILLSLSGYSYAQQALSKYGNDFLSVGAGARALGMGSAHAAVKGDVTSAYWNVAGLADIHQVEGIYMHSERFGGIVGYDYGAIALPLKHTDGVLALSFFRQGVDNIANTLNAWDTERGPNGGPRADAENYITRFSAADLAILISYARNYNDQLSVGGSAKIINHRLGPFANAWGYSLDIGARYRTDVADFAVTVQDVTTMQKMWQVSEGEFEGFQETFGDSIPSGQNEFVLPSVRVGAARSFSVNDFDILAAADMYLLFENRQAFYLNVGRMSFEPHLGAEVTYKDRISFRTGLTDFIIDPVGGFTVSPTVGLGLRVASFYLDYGFASFTGSTSNLGYTHRISLRFNLNGK